MIWIGIAASLVISFTFSGIEAGVLAVNRVRLRHHARRGEIAARKLEEMLLRVERLMITVVVVTNAANLIAFALAYLGLSEVLGIWGAAFALAACLPAFVLLFEFLPKNFFRRFPYRTLVVFARILWAANVFLRPLVGLVSRVLSPLASRGGAPFGVLGPEGIKRATEEGVRGGQIKAVERDFIHATIDMRHHFLADAMLPIGSAVTVPPNMPVPELLALARSSDIDRFPVVGPGGEVLGLVNIFEVLLDGAGAGRAQSYLRRMVSLSADAPASEALKQLRAARLSLVLATDPATGRPVGIAGAEDLVRLMFVGRGRDPK